MFNLAGLRNAIAPDDITLIALVLGAYSVGLVPLVASRLCQNVLFAARDTRTAATIAAIRLAVSLAIGAAVMLPLDRVLLLDGALTGSATSICSRWSPPGRCWTPRFAPIPRSRPAWAPWVWPSAQQSGHGSNWDCCAELSCGAVPLELGCRGQADWPNQRLFGGALGRHLVPAAVAFVVGLPTALALEVLPSVLRAAVAVLVMAGFHLGCGLALRLPAARALTSQLSRLVLNRRQRPHDNAGGTTGDDTVRSPTDDNEGGVTQ